MTAPAHDDAAQEDIRGWIIVGALFLMLSVMITARNSLGLMMPFWRDDLGWSYGFTSTAAAVMMTVMAIGAPLAGRAIDRFGPRTVYAGGMALALVAYVLTSQMTEKWHLIVAFGVIGGIGFGAISPSMVSATVSRHFDRRLGLATSIATSGSTAGQLALMPLLTFLMTVVAWRDGFAVVCVVIVVTAALVLFLIGGDDRKPAAPADAPSTFFETLSVIGRNRNFLLIAGGFFICGFTTAGTVKVHLIPYAIACGFPVLESGTAYGVLSAFSLAGMLAFGMMADKLHRPALLASIYFLRAFTFILLMFIAGNTPLLYIFAVLFGLFDYATFPIVASLIASHLGRHVMGVTMGLIFAGHSLGGAAGSFLGGYLFELFARYDWVWIVSFGLALLAALLSLLVSETRGKQPAPATAAA